MKENIQRDIDFYGDYYGDMLGAKEQAITILELLSFEDRKLMQHIDYRIKSAQSMEAKLQKNNLPIDAYTALTEIYDGVGIRIICGFLDDVFTLVQGIRNCSLWTVFREKDYITLPKPNGYRSYHMILMVPMEKIVIPVEIQIRTISQDAWASLEHQIKYKKDVGHQQLIVDELKRCADELASTDVSMQTIRDLIENKL